MDLNQQIIMTCARPKMMEGKLLSPVPFLAWERVRVRVGGAGGGGCELGTGNGKGTGKELSCKAAER